MTSSEFYTPKGYDKKDSPPLSPTMEDYLEMICRLSEGEGYVRINTLAHHLNVTPPASSKMVHKLREQGLVEFEP